MPADIDDRSSPCTAGMASDAVASLAPGGLCAGAGCFDTAITITHGARPHGARADLRREPRPGSSDTIEQGRLKAIISADDLAFVPARGDVLRSAASPTSSPPSTMPPRGRRRHHRL